MRLIDADALKKIIPTVEADIFENCSRCKLLDDIEVKRIIDEQPTIEAEPKHGRWLKDDIKLGDDYGTVLVCSECDKINWGMVKWNYCPDCGADMREVEE